MNKKELADLKYEMKFMNKELKKLFYNTVGRIAEHNKHNITGGAFGEEQGFLIVGELKEVTKILFDHLADYEKIIKDLRP